MILPIYSLARLDRALGVSARVAARAMTLCCSLNPGLRIRSVRLVDHLEKLWRRRRVYFVVELRVAQNRRNCVNMVANWPSDAETETDRSFQCQGCGARHIFLFIP
jgi:hypothetical protein